MAENSNSNTNQDNANPLDQLVQQDGSQDQSSSNNQAVTQNQPPTQPNQPSQQTDNPTDTQPEPAKTPSPESPAPNADTADPTNTSEKTTNQPANQSEDDTPQTPQVKEHDINMDPADNPLDTVLGAGNQPTSDQPTPQPEKPTPQPEKSEDDQSPDTTHQPSPLTQPQPNSSQSKGPQPQPPQPDPQAPPQPQPNADQSNTKKELENLDQETLEKKAKQIIDDGSTNKSDDSNTGSDGGSKKKILAIAGGLIATLVAGVGVYYAINTVGLPTSSETTADEATCDNGVPVGGTACQNQGDSFMFECVSPNPDQEWSRIDCPSGQTCQGSSCQPASQASSNVTCQVTSGDGPTLSINVQNNGDADGDYHLLQCSCDDGTDPTCDECGFQMMGLAPGESRSHSLTIEDNTCGGIQLDVVPQDGNSPCYAVHMTGEVCEEEEPPAACNETCSDDASCEDGLICDTASGTCRHPNNPQDETCQPPLSACNETCEVDADCADTTDNAVCYNGQCRNQQCTSETDCSCPPPQEYACIGLDSDLVHPNLGDDLTLTCDAGPQTSAYFEFRYNIDSGAFNTLPTSTTGSVSYTITDPGNYLFQCRACQDQAGSTCTPWENVPNN